MRVYLAAVTHLYGPPGASYGIELKAKRMLISPQNPNWPVTKFENALRRTNPEDFCVDSGAHIWLSSFFKTNERVPIEKVETALRSFMASVEALSAKPHFAVELDLQRIYGGDTVAAWRRDLWAPFERRTGIRVCYVWHPGDDWSSYLNDPDMHYLGMGGANSDFDMPTRAAMVHQAYKAGKPVHGFASVNSKWIRQVPFYSVDSTSWASSAFFGGLPKFDGVTGRMQQVKVGKAAFTQDSKKAVGRIAHHGKGKVKIDVLTAGKEQRYARLHDYFQHAADEYDRLERWYTAYWRARGIDWDAAVRGAG